jgi:hypothetical protein
MALSTNNIFSLFTNENYDEKFSSVISEKNSEGIKKIKINFVSIFKVSNCQWNGHKISIGDFKRKYNLIVLSSSFSSSSSSSSIQFKP